MSYVVMARRYRPQTFQEVVGQEAIAKTLGNAVRMDRIGHAFLFAGPRGVGKTSTARILAKALNCQKGPTPEPCNECDICRSISSGSDLDVIEIDAASNNSVDDVRALRENVQYATSRARYKVYIIDEVHMLSNSAFNALLRTLEEPPAHVKFIFATTEPQRLPETIRSRCQRFDFRPVGAEAIAGRLRSICDAEKIEATDEALAAVSRRARGSVRDAESLLDQLVTYADGKIELRHVEEVVGSVSEEKLFEMAGAVARGDAAAAVSLAGEVLDAGGDAAELAGELAAVFHAALEASVLSGEAHAGGGEFAHRSAELAGLAQALGQERLLYAVKALSAARAECVEAPRAQIPIETALVKLCRLGDLVELSRLIDSLGRSPEGAGGRAAGPAAPSPARATGSASASDVRPGAPSQEAKGGAPVAAAEARPAPAGPPAPPRPAPVAGAGEPSLAKPAQGEAALTLDRVGAAWPLVIEKVSAASKPVGLLLAAGSPSAVEGDTVVITFDRKMMFHKERLEEESRRVVVASAASEVFGRRLSVAYAMAGSTAAAAPPAFWRDRPGEPVAHVGTCSDICAPGCLSRPDSHSMLQRAGARASAPEPARPGAQGALADKGVQEILRKFDGEIIRVDRRAESP